MENLMDTAGEFILMARATKAFGEREHGLAKSMNPRKLGESKL